MNPQDKEDHSRLAKITGKVYADPVQPDSNTEQATEISLNTYERLNMYENSTEGMYQQLEIPNVKSKTTRVNIPGRK